MRSAFSISLTGAAACGVGWVSWTNLYYRPLEQRIRILAQQAISDNLSAQQKADLRQGFKLAHGWTWPAGRMRTLLSSIPEETIKVFMKELLTTANDKDVEYYFERCINFLTEHTLLDLSGFKTDKVAAASFRLSGLTRSTALKSGIEKEGRAIWKEFLIELKHCIHQILRVLISAVGLNEITRQKHARFGPQADDMSSVGAHAKLESYLKLIALPATLFGLFQPYVKLKTPALLLTTTTVVTALTALVAYNRYWKPCPIDHSGMKNLTLDLLRENSPIYPRWDVLKKIEAAFQAKKGVILVGPPGAGKSWIVRSLVEQVSLGKLCSFVKNAQMFSCNGSSIKFGGGPESTLLVATEERFKQYRGQVMFFIDELHNLFKSDSIFGDSVGEELKTFCEDFKYVIGATTTDEFHTFIRDKTTIVDRRFEIIHLEPMQQRQIQVALSQYLERTNSKIAFDSSVIDYIIEKAGTFNPNTSTIDAAHALLNRAIQKMTSVVHSELIERVVQLEDALGVMEQQAINGEHGLDLETLTDQLGRKQAELATAREELEQKNLRTQRMQRMQIYRLKLKRDSYRLSTPHIDWDNKRALARQWIALHARIRIVEGVIAHERESLGLPRCLDRTLIDCVLAERANGR